jgi:hypothetical protein
LAKDQPDDILKVLLAGGLAWLVPGLGHFFLGHRARAVIFFAAVTLAFWSGVAVGGVRQVINPKEHRVWFMAQVCTGGNALAGVALAKGVERKLVAQGGPAEYVGHYISEDVGLHYAGVAGLLNLLVIFDALLRADPNTRPRQASPPPEGSVA